MDSESDVALETEQLGKKYGKNRAQNWALRNCSFRLPPGRIAALVGPIGAGKSTPLTGSGSSRASKRASISCWPRQWSSWLSGTG